MTTGYPAASVWLPLWMPLLLLQTFAHSLAQRYGCCAACYCSSLCSHTSLCEQEFAVPFSVQSQPGGSSRVRGCNLSINVPWLHLTLLPCVAQVFIDDPLPQRRVDPAGAVCRAAKLWLASGAYTHTATPSLPHTKIGEGASSSSLDGVACGTCSSHTSTSSTMNVSYTQHELGSLRLLCRGSVDAYIASKVCVQRQVRTPLSPASSPLCVTAWSSSGTSGGWHQV